MSDAVKAALVTGASSGIGRAVAVALLQNGYKVVLASRHRDALAETAALAGDNAAMAIVQPTDVTDNKSVAELFRKIEQECGRLDVLFNNAGLFPRAAPTDKVSYEDWANAVDVNLTGAFLVAQAAFAMMKTQSPRGGRIINNGSVSAQRPRPNSVAYTATKHAITGLTKSLALDGRAFDIAVGQIDIGNAATDLMVGVAKDVKQRGEETEPLIDVRHVADAVLYICGLPLDANVLSMTLMATKMPFVGRG
jgi:NAD(P)-dependent dehydrogenase (short-subunit alcohol dehydrogenase family)